MEGRMEAGERVAWMDSVGPLNERVEQMAQHNQMVDFGKMFLSLYRSV